MTIKELVERSHANARTKGFWDRPRNDAEMIMLMVTELSEAVEVLRKDGLKDAVAEEMSDCMIRIADYCGGRGIDLEEAIKKKMKVNERRLYRHGKEF